MKLLVIKTSSFGDILHTLPALTDAARSVDGLICDWLVEESFAAIPAWHPAVRDVIPVSLRGWRRPPWLQHGPAIRRFMRRLRREHYDLVLDAQGLLKSALLGRLACGRRVGFDRRGAREPVAARLYERTVAVEVIGRHAVDRTRDLFAGALGYALPDTVDYGLRLPDLDTATGTGKPYLVFIPGTTWASKRWPARYWRTLSELAVTAGWPVQLLAGSPAEHAAARRIAGNLDNVRIQASPALEALARLLLNARAVVSVDSGPGHLAAALGTPAVSIYGATDPSLTGTRGPRQVHLRADYECAPCLRRRCRFADSGQIHPDCYASVPPVTVWSTLRDLIKAS